MPLLRRLERLGPVADPANRGVVADPPRGRFRLLVERERALEAAKEEEKRKAKMSLSVSGQNVSIYDGNTEENAPLELWSDIPKGDDIPNIECFRSNTLRAGECFTIVRSTSPKVAMFLSLLNKSIASSSEKICCPLAFCKEVSTSTSDL